MTERTREEHIEWCKQRAREYLERGDITNAIASMMSDMSKHPDCGVHSSISMLGLMAASQNNRKDAERFIEGFN